MELEISLTVRIHSWGRLFTDEGQILVAVEVVKASIWFVPC